MRRWSEERAQAATEYLGVLALVVTVIAALVAFGPSLGKTIEHAISGMTDGATTHGGTTHAAPTLDEGVDGGTGARLALGAPGPKGCGIKGKRKGPPCRTSNGPPKGVVKTLCGIPTVAGAVSHHPAVTAAGVVCWVAG
jgi:hypothetical protein